MTKNKSGKKKKLNKKKVANVLILFLVIGLSIYYVMNLHIKRIIISGNILVKDYEIIEEAGIKDYPLIYKLSLSTIEENVSKIELINQVKIKRNIFGHIKIEVKEDTPLCYISKDTILTSSSKKVNNIITYGLPTLITPIEEEKMSVLAETLKKIKPDILKLISEISYTPSISAKGETIDPDRFTFNLNDGNKAIVNKLNIEKFNNYLNTVNATVANMGSIVKGQYYFASATDKVTFASFDSMNKPVEVKEEKDESKL